MKMPVPPHIYRKIIREPWYCPNCGARNIPDDGRCFKCSTKKPPSLAGWRDSEGRVY